MTAKQLFISIPSIAILALVGWLGYIAAQSAWVIAAFQVALVTLALAALLGVAGSLAFAAMWAWTRWERWQAEVETAQGQSVQFHSHQGQTFAVNPKGLPIQALGNDTRTLILPSEDEPDESRLMRWLAGHRRQRVIDGELAAPEQVFELPAPSVPDVVRLEDAIDHGNVSINRLFLGAGPGGEPIYGRLKDLSHIAIGGTSRWGKSTLEQALLYQLVIAREEIDFYLSDVGGTAFLSFGIPYADSPTLSEKLVAKVYSIFEERKAAFKDAGQQVRTGIRSLDIFNQITGASLPVIVLAMDEVTALMADSKQMAHQINSLILQAGKYGIFLILSGQNWTAKNIGTTTRDQFSSRFQMKAMDRYQANILISNSGAEQFTTKGRASVLLPGAVAPVQIQTPLIEEETISQAASFRQRQTDDLRRLFEDEPEQGEMTPREQIILDMFDAGESLNSISKEINDGRIGGTYNAEIKTTVKKWRNMDL